MNPFTQPKINTKKIPVYVQFLGDKKNVSIGTMDKFKEATKENMTELKKAYNDLQLIAQVEELNNAPVPGNQPVAANQSPPGNPIVDDSETVAGNETVTGNQPVADSPTAAQDLEQAEQNSNNVTNFNSEFQGKGGGRKKTRRRRRKSKVARKSNKHRRH